MGEDRTTFKVVVLGEGRVGKTSLSLRYVTGEFSSTQESTVAANFLEKRLNIGKRLVQLNIHDTAGQERFHSLAPIYYRGAEGALIVYDITDAASFARAETWVKELHTEASTQIAIVICANKCDLQNKRQVSREDAERFAESVSAEHVEVSAKTAEGVERAFCLLTQAMLRIKFPARAPTLRVDEEAPKQSSCC